MTVKRSCDLCRKRKIKCVLPGGGDNIQDDTENAANGKAKVPCEGCTNLDLECTYEAERKRRGRPNSYLVAARRSSSSQANRPSDIRPSQVASTSQEPFQQAVPPPPPVPENTLAPIRNNVRFQATYTNDFSLDVPQPTPGRTPGAFVISPESDLNAYSTESWSIDVPFARNPAGGPDRGHDRDSSSRSHPYDSSGRSGGPNGGAGHGPNRDGRLRPPTLHVEDVFDWSTLSFFMSLYIRHLHALVPLVHKPTFSQALTMRLDQRDVGFRAFLFSLTTYVICQSPLSRMISRFSQDELEQLQRRAHRASQQLQDKRYRRPSVMQIATLICDSYLHAACDRPAQTAAVLGEAIQLTYVIKLHDEQYMQSLGLNCIELELRRRLYWHLHAIDFTWASAGMPLHMNDFEGCPDYPLEIDDEYITARGAFDQPADQVSFLVGFVELAKIFRIFAELLLRHRRFLRSKRVTFSDRQQATEWIEESTAEVNRIMHGLPSVLREPDQTRQQHVTEEAAAVYSMQTANLYVTAASVNFAFCDFRADIDPDSPEVSMERERVGREMYEMLASLSLDSLAANGESMRGKVLRIIQALNQNPEQMSESLKNWWEMFSMVQFVQMIPYTLPESLLPSRAPSPVPDS